MAITEEPSISALLEKLAALEARFAELEQKHKSVSEVPQKDNNDERAPVEEAAAPKPPNIVNGETQTGNEEEESSPHTRVKIIKKITDADTGERIEKEEQQSKDSKSDVKSDLAFVLKKIIQEKFSEDDATSEIDIINPDLWNLLKEHLGAHPYHIFRGAPTTLYSPYEAIIFSWESLRRTVAQTAKDDKEKRAREDLGLLLDILSGGSSGDAKLDKFFKARDVSLHDNNVQFDNLWTLFPPGTVVYGKPFQDQHQVFVVRDNLRAWPLRDTRVWKLDCWTYDWTGTVFQRSCFTIPFEQFEGHKSITSLPFFPFERHSAYTDIMSELIERGKQFRRFCTAKEGERLFEYKGDSVFGKKGFTGLQSDDDVSDLQSQNSFFELQFGGRLGGRSRGRRLPPETVKPSVAKSSHTESRVMVDHLSYFQYGPSIARNGSLEPSLEEWDCMCTDCQQNEGLARKYRTSFDKVEMRKTTAYWDDEQYMLCPPRVLGYVLRDKQWAQLQVTCVRTIPLEDDKNAWHDRLRLADDSTGSFKSKDPSTKQLLFDLVRSHISAVPNNTADSQVSEDRLLEVDDIVPGKGKGLVILLYGPPGVGKTSTAETIAVATRKPLFSISVADVGTKARHVEANLSRIFSLATAWQAILLIDEADVFLESRGRGPSTSMDRNALVSVFLRVLEYYQGIMFLTTNQIAQFDVAIPSRIHISIQYQSLKPPQMDGIFKGFLQPLEDQGLLDNFDEIMEWLKEDVYSLGFDGRQIRNIVTTALGLARAERKFRHGKGKLNKGHLKSVVKNVRAFKTDFTVQFDRYVTSQEKMIG